MTVAHNHLSASASDPAPQPPYGGGGMRWVSTGPAALLYSLANQLISIYARLQALYSEITQSEVTLQSQTIMAGADAQRAAGKQQANALYCQAVGSFASGLVTAATALMTNRSNKPLAEKVGTQETELSNLKNLDKIQNKPDLVVTDEEKPNATDINNRKAELLKDKNYLTKKFEGRNAKFMENLDKAAIGSMDSKEFETFQSNLQSEMSNLTKRINDTHSMIQTNTTQISSQGQMFNGFVTGSAQVGQGIYTAKAAQYNAAEKVNSGVQQLANSTGETTRSNLAKYYDAVAGLIATARQGAAYKS